MRSGRIAINATDDPGSHLRAKAAHLRAVETHEQAAELHEASANLHEQHAVEMLEFGYPDRVARAERIADDERELADRERARADKHRRSAEDEVSAH